MIFGDIARRMGNLQRPLSLFGEYALDRVEKGFDREEDPEGKPWTALNPEYAKRKKGPSILTEEGDLRGSFSSLVRVHQVVIGPGSDIPYDRAHQKGYPPNNLPPRPHTGATEKDANNMALILMGHFRGLTEI